MNNINFNYTIFWGLNFDINDNLNILKPIDEEDKNYSVISKQPWAQQHKKGIGDLLWKTKADEIEDEEQKQTYQYLDDEMDNYLESQIYPWLEEDKKKIQQSKNPLEKYKNGGKIVEGN